MGILCCIIFYAFIGIKTYLDKFGSKPDRVFLSTCMWDYHYYHQTYGRGVNSGHPQWNQWLNDFKRNNMERLKQIRNEFNRLSYYKFGKGKIIDFGLRTAVTNEGGKEFLESFNTILRQMARDLNLTLYDMENDLWATINFAKDILRYHILPLQQTKYWTYSTLVTYITNMVISMYLNRYQILLLVLKLN